MVPRLPQEQRGHDDQHPEHDAVAERGHLAHDLVAHRRTVGFEPGQRTLIQPLRHALFDRGREQREDGDGHQPDDDADGEKRGQRAPEAADVTGDEAERTIQRIPQEMEFPPRGLPSFGSRIVRAHGASPVGAGYMPVPQ